MYVLSKCFIEPAFTSKIYNDYKKLKFPNFCGWKRVKFVNCQKQFDLLFSNKNSIINELKNRNGWIGFRFVNLRASVKVLCPRSVKTKSS